MKYSIETRVSTYRPDNKDRYFAEVFMGEVCVETTTFYTSQLEARIAGMEILARILIQTIDEWNRMPKED